MSKKTRISSIHDAQKHIDRVIRITGEIEEWLDLDGIDVKHQFHDGHYEDHTQETEYGTTTATTVVRWEYRFARIQWFLASVAVATDEELYRVALHEYCHVLMGAMQDCLKPNHNMKLEERVTENFFRAILSAKEAK